MKIFRCHWEWSYSNKQSRKWCETASKQIPGSEQKKQKGHKLWQTDIPWQQVDQSIGNI